MTDGRPLAGGGLAGRGWLQGGGGEWEWLEMFQSDSSAARRAGAFPSRHGPSAHERTRGLTDSPGETETILALATSTVNSRRD